MFSARVEAPEREESRTFPGIIDKNTHRKRHRLSPPGLLDPLADASIHLLPQHGRDVVIVDR